MIATPPVDVLASVGLSLSGRQAPLSGLVCLFTLGGREVYADHLLFRCQISA